MPNRPLVGPPHTFLASLGLPHLLEERSSPDFRAAFGTLARGSQGLDVAVARIRLSGIDLTPEELASVEAIRLLVARLDAPALRAEAEAVLLDPEKARNLEYLVHRLRAGAIQVRSAPLGGWAPDFTVFRRGGRPWSLLVGLHWFARPFPHGGPALASVHGAAAASTVERRFEELWRRAHDIGPAVFDLLRAARRRISGDEGEARPQPHPPLAPRRASIRKPLSHKGKRASKGARDILDTPTGSD